MKALFMVLRQPVFRAVLFFVPVLCLLIASGSDSASAQTSDPFPAPPERELYPPIPGSNDKGSILDATNPMDLINRLRRATAMDDATTPSDAIDEALRSFEAEATDSSPSILSQP